MPRSIPVFITALAVCFLSVSSLLAADDKVDASVTNSTRSTVTNVVVAGKRYVGDISESSSGTWTPGLTSGETYALFKIARNAMTGCVDSEKLLPQLEKGEVTKKLAAKYGASVAIIVDGEERGRQDQFLPNRPMHEQISSLMKKAAMTQSNTPCISEKELDTAGIVITLASPLIRVRTLEKFELGTHGILIQKGPIFEGCLPEEPVEAELNLDQMMDALIARTRFPEGSWKRGTRYNLFTTYTLAESWPTPRPE